MSTILRRKIIIICVFVIIIFLGTSKYFKDHSPDQKQTPILNYQDCINTDNTVTNSIEGTCTTQDGRIFAKERAVIAKYDNASIDDIILETPKPGDVTGKRFLIRGKARGMWFFEASFPVTILDATGKVLVRTHAKAEAPWMTEDFVPFTATITAPTTYIGKATIVLQKDNPSGIKEKDASISFPVTIEY